MAHEHSGQAYHFDDIIRTVTKQRKGIRNMKRRGLMKRKTLLVLFAVSCAILLPDAADRKQNSRRIRKRSSRRGWKSIILEIMNIGRAILSGGRR